MVIIVDAANVMGSRPDGWWRDRAGAASRLIDSIATALSKGALTGPVIVVVEGRARAAADGTGAANRGLEVVAAGGSGDDAIVDAADAARAAGDEVVVVTADRGLRQRVVDLGATVEGPRTFLDRL